MTVQISIFLIVRGSNMYVSEFSTEVETYCVSQVPRCTATVQIVGDWNEINELKTNILQIRGDIMPIHGFNSMLDVFTPIAIRDSLRPSIKRVIFHNPATIVFWTDNTKTVVKCKPGDTFNEELGLAMCISKKYLGDNFHSEFRKYLSADKEVEE